MAPYPSRFRHLSSRELEVLQHTCRGRSASEIGVILGISNRTVEAHLRNIHEKSGTHNAAEMCYEYGREQSNGILRHGLGATTSQIAPGH